MARRRKTQLGTGRLAALLLTLIFVATACDQPNGVVGMPTVGGAAPMLQIAAQPNDAPRVVVNYVRTFADSAVEVELQTADGETVEVRAQTDVSALFSDLDPGSYRVITEEREHIVASDTGAVLAGQRLALSDTFVVSTGTVTSLVCSDSGCTVS